MGRALGRYEILRPLGEGGMGNVWLARVPASAPTSPSNLYALKTLAPRYANHPRACALFAKEARIAASISHPNVVRLLEVGESDEGELFFVMEWIDGMSLRDLLLTIDSAGDLTPVHIALRIAADACAGLHAAHELVGPDGRSFGLVHRDISPHNMIVSRLGVTKIIDFGIAKSRERLSGDTTSSGGLKGKVRYMAPEQALERPVDRRADIFSLGAVLFILITGRPPFDGTNDVAILRALLSPTPIEIPSFVPEPIAAILRRALARRPEDRFADALEMQRALEDALVSLGHVTTSTVDVARYLQSLDPAQSNADLTCSISTNRFESFESFEQTPARRQTPRTLVLPRKTWGPTTIALSAAALSIAAAVGILARSTPPSITTTTASAPPSVSVDEPAPTPTTATAPPPSSAPTPPVVVPHVASKRAVVKTRKSSVPASASATDVKTALEDRR